MMVKINILVAVLFNLYICHCNAVSLQEQLEHIGRRRRENIGIPVDQYRRRSNRRLLGDEGTILGHPSRPSHLPEAEPILPGHTLIKPTLGMLKSAVKFPHKDLDDGSGVYGNFETLGAKYPGTEDRVKYGSFRRMPSDYYLVDLPLAQHQFSPKSNNLVSKLGLEPVDKYDAVLKVMNQLRHEKSHRHHKNQKKPYLDLELVFSKDRVRKPNRSYNLGQRDNEDDFLELLNQPRYKKSQRPLRPQKKSSLDLEILLSDYMNENRNADYILKQLLKDEDRQTQELHLQKILKHFKASRRMIMSSEEIEKMQGHDKIALLKELHKKEDNFQDTREAGKEKEHTNNNKLLDQNFFNHIAVKNSAPDFQTLLPGKPKPIGNFTDHNWWYFNQDDFTPFSQFEAQPETDVEDLAE